MKRWLALLLLLWASPGWAVVDPVSWWTFNEGSGTTATDTGSGGNTGTLEASATWGTGNIGSYALSLDGTNGNYVLVGDPGSGNLDFGTSDFSISLWFKTSDTTNTEMLVNKRFSGSCEPALDEGYYIIMDPGGDFFGAICDGGTVNKGTAVWAGKADGAWHHLVMLVDTTNDVLQLYGDGVQVGSDTDITGYGSLSNNQGLAIGSDNFATAVFNGLIDDVRIYNRVITPTEITDMYNQTEGGGLPTNFFARRR